MKRASVLSKQIGKGKGNTSFAEKFVADELAPKVNWRNILLNRLIKIKDDERSLSTPDRRFVHSGLYLEGCSDKEEALTGVKVAVDTSGSMSISDLEKAFKQIEDLLKTYKLDAELIFWDDGIQSITKFDDKASFKLAQLRATGRGGTNPDCIFKLFNSREYTSGLKQKPEVILIFTDGYFYGPSDEYKARYSRDTVWILSRENEESIRDFKPTFGKVAKLKFKDN